MSELASKPSTPGRVGGRDRLVDRYDAILLDLDGTVYRGERALPAAEDAIAAIRNAGTAIRFVTNNASRAPAEVASLLNAMGIPADPAEVSTSGRTAAAMVAERLDPGAEVLVLGTEALAEEARAVGLQPVRDARPSVAAVLQGMSPDIGWRDLAEACLVLRAGALWVASNTDLTLPTERGELPGNGAMVAALSAATGREPVVAGKPQAPLLVEAAELAGANHPLVVGDRLDSDVAGAVAAGFDVLLVLTGAGRPADLLATPPEGRPRYVAADLSAITEPARHLELADRPEWHIHADGVLAVSWRGGAAVPDPVDLLRALGAAGGDGRIRGEDDTTRTALAELGLPGTLT